MRRTLQNIHNAYSELEHNAHQQQVQQVNLEDESSDVAPSVIHPRSKPLEPTP